MSPIHVDTPATAFGGGIGQAEEGLASQEQQGGNKVFAAAEQMQNDILTRNVSAAVFNKLGPDIDAKFSKYLTLEGQAAHDAYEPFIKDINDTIEKGAGQFASPVAQNMYLANARYLRQRVELQGSMYAAQQLKKSFIDTNTAATENLTNQSVFMQNDSATVLKNGEQVRSNAEMNALHLNMSGPEAQAKIDQEVGRYYQRVIEAKMLTPPGQGGGAQNALALFNAARGKMDANSAISIERMLRPVLRDQEGTDIVGQAMQGGAFGGAPGGSGGTVPQWKGGAVSADQLDQAIHGQESGGAANAPTSVAGAVGGGQIMPATFRQYAKPGEDINDPKDNAVVRARIVTDLAKRFDGDPARVAVGYFSGPDNVAPVGSPTPWKNDAADKTGKTTSSYVSDVLQRLGGTATGGGEGMASPSGWKMPDWSKMEQDILARTAGDSELQGIALGKLAQTRQRIEMATRTERDDITHKLDGWTKAAEAGLPISVPTDRIDAVFEPDMAARIKTQLGVSQAAGQVLSGLKFASPEQLSEAMTDLAGGKGTLSDTIRARLGKETGGSVTMPAGPGQQGASLPPELYPMQAQIANRALQLIRDRETALVGDRTTPGNPAAYALQEPSVAAAAKAMDQKNPDTFGAYARAQLAIQSHLGVPDEKQHVLTKDMADTFTQQVMQPGGDAKQALDKFQQQWGDAWTHVFGDMVTLGKLPAAYQGVIALDDPKMAATLSRAIGEQAKTGKVWDDILGKEGGGGKPVGPTLRDNINSSGPMQALETSWRGSRATLAQSQSMRDAVHTLAYGLSYYNQDGQAAQHAVDAFTSRYRFIANGGARVPADKYDTVMGNAGQGLEGLTPQNTAIPQGFRTEDTPEAKRLGATMPTAQDYIANLQANPTWITSQKGDGLNLLDHADRLVRDTKGNPFFVPFDGKPLVGRQMEAPPMAMPGP